MNVNAIRAVLHETARQLAMRGYHLSHGSGAAVRVVYDEAFSDRASPSTWVRTEMLFPVLYNDGTRVPIGEVVLFLLELLSGCSTGFTLSEAGGIAVEGRAVERDDHIAVRAWVYDIAALRRLVGRWATRLRQRAICMEVFERARLELISGAAKANAAPLELDLEAEAAE